VNLISNYKKLLLR